MLFGTDGARGVANEELTIDVAMAIGRAAAEYLPSGARVVLGRDTRVSSPMLEAALTAGLTARGVDVFLAGIVPTPALSFLIRHYRADAGVMISASHNPPEYNGIKLLDGQGRKWEPEQERLLEEVMTRTEWSYTRHMGQVWHHEGIAVEAYRRYLLGIFAGRIPPLSIVVDVAHGAATETAPAVLQQLGAKVMVLHAEPLGERINQGSGATHPDVLRQHVLAQGADLGLSFDGDADRVIAVDGQGRIVDGDEILYTLGTGLHMRGQLPHNLVVATVMSNLGLEQALDRQGIRLMRTPVGDRWVAKAMAEHGATLGGEQSGHIIVKQWTETGDGLLTGLELLAELDRRDMTLAQAVAPVERFPQVLHNVRLPAPLTGPWQQIPGLSALVEEATRDLGDQGRVLIRPSGTEPLLRIMLEGRDVDQIEAWAHRLTTVVRDALESAKA